MAYVYKHIRKDTNEVFYIGIGKAEKRIYSKCDRNKHWKNIVNSVGFEYEVIKDGLDWESACELEKQLIKQYGRRDLNTGTLVNMTDGGDGANGILCTTERNQKISKALTGKIKPKLTEEHKQKIRETALRNRKNGINTGLAKTVEAEANRVDKIIKSQKGIPKPQSAVFGNKNRTKNKIIWQQK